MRDFEIEEWKLRYFKGIDDEATGPRFMAWDGGSTSKTAYGEYMYWKYCELVEDEDDEE